MDSRPMWFEGMTENGDLYRIEAIYSEFAPPNAPPVRFKINPFEVTGKASTIEGEHKFVDRGLKLTKSIQVVKLSITSWRVKGEYAFAPMATIRLPFGRKRTMIRVPVQELYHLLPSNRVVLNKAPEPEPQQPEPNQSEIDDAA